MCLTFRRARPSVVSSPRQISEVCEEPSKESLYHYNIPGITPPSARVDPKLKISPRPPLRPWDIWKFGFAVISKAIQVTGDILSHHIWGPRKKSWGIEMTVVSSVMRGVGRHSSLVNIATVRFLMSIGGLVPLPSDALATPVTFRVRKRHLRGILSQFDAAETGSRELSGEWVVSKRTWRRLQAKWRSIRNQRKLPGSTPKFTDRVILYVHGGAYYLSSAAAQRLISVPLAKFTDARVFALDYRLAPETKFPGSLHDVVSGYFRLTEDLHVPPENILLAGDSAGGGLCLALLMYLRDNDYPLPGGAILLSPWVDLTMSCHSWDSNAIFDVVPLPTHDNHMHPIALYLGERMEEYLTHPYASPLFGDFKKFPPLLIQVGDAEVLRDEITLLAHKATLAGIDVRYELFEDAIHIFQLYPFLTVTHRAFRSIRDFVRNLPPGIKNHSSHGLSFRAELHLGQEVENEHTAVINGDGMRAGTGLEGIQNEVRVKARKIYSSWRHSSRIWSVVASPTEGHNKDTRHVTATSPHTSTSARIPEIRRRHSAFTIVDPSLVTSPDYRNYAKPQRASPDDTRRSAVVVSNVNPPLNSLSLRRLSASHPDIVSLVEDWSNSGPANQIRFYSA